MDMKELLKKTELFRGLTDSELAKITSICQERSLSSGELFAVEGEPGHEMCIIKHGLMEIELRQGEDLPPKAIIHLGTGQLIGEMSLIDHANRSATVRAIQTPTSLLVINHQDFHDLCEENAHIGYIVMKNMASDLSFKLRHRSLELRGR